MRRVKITGAPPKDWVDDASDITKALRAASDEAERKDILKTHEGFWRDHRILDWLLEQFNNKCWYTEAYESVSSIHVDHFRPKGRVKECLGGSMQEGYWWLAFEWSNYRICGQLVNVKKGDLFPVVEGPRCTHDGIVSLHLEAPMLIDPIDEDDVGLISYEKDEDGCRAVCSGGVSQADRQRVKETIEILGLNRLDRLNTKRAQFWDACMNEIAEYMAPTHAQALRKIAQASARTRLKKMVAYEAEFSSVVMACLRKNGPDPLKHAVLSSKT